MKGLEPNPDPLVLNGNEDLGDAVAANASVAVSAPVPADPELGLVIAAWPTLANPIKAGNCRDGEGGKAIGVGGLKLLEAEAQQGPENSKST